MWGSWWLITLCAGREPQVSLAVSAEANELQIADGRLVFPFASGNEFFPIGIPTGNEGEYPLSPEAAIRSVASTRVQLVSRVPELVMPPRFNGFPQAARWRIHFESPVSVKLRSKDLLAQEVYIGRDGLDAANAIREYVPSDEQPPAFTFHFAPPPTFKESRASYHGRLGSGLLQAIVNRQSDSPVNFDLIWAGGAN
jgi:hypothetical protein